jgi:hydrogenase expression/formation protein HypC
MCLAIPGKVEQIEGQGPLELSAIVDFEGVRKTVHLLYLPDVQVGEYVLVQAGYATQRIPEREALEALRIAREPLASLPRIAPAVPTGER